MPKTKTQPREADTEVDAKDDTDAGPVGPDTETITLEFRGQKFVVPKRRGRWPIDAVLSFGDRDYPRAFKALLGPKDWRRFTSVAGTLDDFDEFVYPALTQLSDECIF